MSEATRTFVGLPLPQVFRQKVERLCQNLARVLPKARWVHPADFHLTLAFLGEIPHADLRDVCKAVAEVSVKLPQFAISLKGIGAFPEVAKPRVIWAGVEGDIESLNTLRKQVVEAVSQAGYPPDDNRFHPHITLGRLKPGRSDPSVDLQNQEAHLRTWTAGPWIAETVITYASHHVTDGPSYTPVATARLARSNL